MTDICSFTQSINYPISPSINQSTTLYYGRRDRAKYVIYGFMSHINRRRDFSPMGAARCIAKQNGFRATCLRLRITERI